MLTNFYSQDHYRLHLNACPTEPEFILFFKKKNTVDPEQLASSEAS